MQIDQSEFDALLDGLRHTRTARRLLGASTDELDAELKPVLADGRALTEDTDRAQAEGTFDARRRELEERCFAIGLRGVLVQAAFLARRRVIVEDAAAATAARAPRCGGRTRRRFRAE